MSYRDSCEHGYDRGFGCEVCQAERDRLKQIDATFREKFESLAKKAAAKESAELTRLRNIEAKASAYLKALAVISDINDRGRDDSGKRDTPSYAQWLVADCAYTEAREDLRRALEDKA